MEIAYASAKRGDVAYTFATWEKEAIVRGFKAEIKRLEKKIDRLENHPKNEGQVTYTEEIRITRGCIEVLKENISDLS
jgi:hypothetical protein